MYHRNREDGADPSPKCWLYVLAACTTISDSAGMIVVATDVQLSEVLASSVLLMQLWPSAFHEVKLLITVLRMSVPSLAEALTTGLVTLLLPPSVETAHELVLVAGGAQLRAIAQNKDGEPVPTAHQHLADVVRLEVLDVFAEGRSALRVAG